MSGYGGPPGGTPMGVPGGGDDDYRSIVFDESFVRAARIREYSADERLDDGGRAVSPRHAWDPFSRHRQAFALVLLMALAFGTAIFLGIRHPYRPVAVPASGPLRVSLVALTPSGPVPAAEDDQLYAQSGAGRWAVGAAGITLPRAHAVGRYSADQVLVALDIAKRYLTASSLDTAELTDGDLNEVEDLLAPGELDQFKRSLTSPADDGRHAATGWLVRFDLPHVVLADDRIRVRGTVSVTGGTRDLEVLTDHTMVYTVRPAGDLTRPPSLFTVRRELRMSFTREDLLTGRVEVDQAAVEAGPLACGTRLAASFEPLMAGQSAPPPAGTDPYRRTTAVAAACHPMATPPTPAPTATQPAPHGTTGRHH
ncbi:SCO2583 family membrane protein [Streptantibioticus silvisoli]|uniref:SCO2583 family membrane protein n=1 Tax=Streptantibioticus silvisoli TaxID=2705255 RepID=UPI003FD8EF4E